MIREISYSTKENPFAIKSAKKIDKKNNLVSMPLKSSMPVFNYSANNAEANYVPFLGKSEISFGNATKQQQVVVIDGPRPTAADAAFGVENITKKDAYKLTKGHFYDKSANDLAVLIGSGKNVILPYSEGVTPEILVDNFSRNLKDKKYSGQGLHNYDTDVLFVNTKEINMTQQSALEKVMNINKEAQFRKKIVFVSDFQVLAEGIYKAGVDDVNYFLEKCAPNISLVGLISKKELAKPDPPIPQYAGFAKSILNNMEKLELRGLSANDTKEYMKANLKLVNDIFKKYPDANVKISYNAIDAIVDKSATTIEGEFPAKAFKLIDMITAAKLSESKAFADKKLIPYTKSYNANSKTMTAVPTNKNVFKLEDNNVNITTSDVKRFFDKHYGIVDALRPAAGQFQLAENVKTKFSDIGGLHEVKETLKQDYMPYLENPKKYLSERLKAPRGSIFKGPPGTGKTLLAKALAGESNVPFIAASGSEFVEIFVGKGAQRVRELFATARQKAAESGKNMAIIFIDEIDAIGGARGNGSSGHNEREATLNQLLTEMQGFKEDSKIKVLVFAATNRADLLDKALLRRFDNAIDVQNPESVADRLEVLNIHARKLPFTDEAAKTKILKEVAEITEGLSGDELSKVMEKAINIVGRRTTDKFITHNDVVEGFLQVIAGPIDKVTDEPIEEIRKTVRHEGGHAVLIDTLKQEKVSFITLDPRGNFLGAVFKRPTKKMSPNFKSVIFSAATSYAGGHAEPDYKMYGHAAGVSQDTKNATNIIKSAITKWALGLHTPPIAIGTAENGAELFDPMFNTYQNEIKKDYKLFSETAQKVSKLVVDFHEDFLDDYVKRFEDNAGKGGNNLAGDAFSQLRQQWLKETGKVDAEKRLFKEANRIVETAYNSNKNIFTKIARKLARIVR